MIKKVLLTSEESKKRFQYEYNNRSGNALSMEYIDRANTYGFYKKDELVGGYIININQPLRIIDIINSAHSEKNISLPIMEDNCAEVTSIWMDSKKHTTLSRLYIYRQSLLDGFRTKKKYLLGGASNIKLIKINLSCFPNILFYGKVDSTVVKENSKWMAFYSTKYICFKGFYLNFLGRLFSSKLLRKYHEKILNSSLQQYEKRCSSLKDGNNNEK